MLENDLVRRDGGLRFYRSGEFGGFGEWTVELIWSVRGPFMCSFGRNTWWH